MPLRTFTVTIFSRTMFCPSLRTNAKRGKRHLDGQLQKIGWAEAAKALLHECHKLRRACGGVLLLHGSDMRAIDAALQQLRPAAPHLRIVTTCAGRGHAERLWEAVGAARHGALVAVNAGSPDSELAPLLRRAGVRCASVFLYASPSDLVKPALAAGNPRDALDALERFYRTVGGRVRRADGALGTLRRADVQRLMASVRRAVPAGSALSHRCDVVERDLLTALGLISLPKVYLHHRQPHDAALALSQVWGPPPRCGVDTGNLHEAFRALLPPTAGDASVLPDSDDHQQDVVWQMLLDTSHPPPVHFINGRSASSLIKRPCGVVGC